MVERLEVILFVFFPPSLVEALERLSPLLLLGLETPEDEGDGDGRILLQAVHDVPRFVPVDPLNRLPVNHLARSA